MAENAEFEDHVELDDDNYTEEEDDVEEPMEDEGSGEGGEENCEDFQEDIRSGESGKEHSLGVDTKNFHVGVVDDEGNSPANEAERKKYAKLLSLPPHGSEVSIGGLPRDILEEDLRELCESFGEIFEIRVMKNRDTGESKGSAFVAFRAKVTAQKAIEELHNKEFKGRTLCCSLSESKYRLFIGNVPKACTDDEFRKIIEAAGPGAETIKLIKNPGCNRGFAFVEYYNNACADYSRQQMSAASFKLDGNTPTVTWADRKITPDHSAAASQMRSTSCNMLVVVLKDMKDGLDIVQNKIQLLTAKVKANNFPTSDGISYLEAKHLLLLSYCQSLVYYLLRKAKGLSIHGHPVVKSLVEVRLFLEKIRPVDKKLQYQVQKLTKVTATNTTADTPGPTVKETDEAHEMEDLLRYRPNPDLLVSQTNENQEDGSSVYRPPKFAPSSMDEDKMTRQERNAMRK